MSLERRAQGSDLLFSPTWLLNSNCFQDTLTAKPFLDWDTKAWPWRSPFSAFRVTGSPLCVMPHVCPVLSLMHIMAYAPQTTTKLSIPARAPWSTVPVPCQALAAARTLWLSSPPRWTWRHSGWSSSFWSLSCNPNQTYEERSWVMFWTLKGKMETDSERKPTSSMKWQEYFVFGRGGSIIEKNRGLG